MLTNANLVSKSEVMIGFQNSGSASTQQMGIGVVRVTTTGAQDYSMGAYNVGAVNTDVFSDGNGRSDILVERVG